MVTFKKPPLSKLAPGKTNYVRFRLSHDVADEMSPSERPLGDALDGDATFFASEDSVETAWYIVGPVPGDVTMAQEYASGSRGTVDGG